MGDAALVADVTAETWAAAPVRDRIDTMARLRKDHRHGPIG